MVITVDETERFVTYNRMTGRGSDQELRCDDCGLWFTPTIGNPVPACAEHYDSVVAYHRSLWQECERLATQEVALQRLLSAVLVLPG